MKPYPLRFKEEARTDITESYNWYEEQSAGLGDKFIFSIDDKLKEIKRNPFGFKRIYKNFRQAAVIRFPFVIVFEIEGAAIIIYSVFNTWQKPSKKFKRLRKK